jgi:MFS family permease
MEGVRFSRATGTTRSRVLVITRRELPSDQRFLLGASAAGSFGAGIGRTAIPLLAVTALGASPFEVGVLNVAQTAAFIVIGLPAGAIVDRVRKRQTMIAMNLVRLALSAALIVLWQAGLLDIGGLVVLVALMGCATVFFDIAAMACLSHLVGRDGLLAANGQLQGVSSATSVGAPVTAGSLAAVIGAALTTVGVSIGYAVSALLIGRIQPREIPAEPRPWRTLWSETGEGLRYVFGTDTLRAIGFCTAGVNLAQAARATMLVVFLVQLGFGPGEIGIATAASGIGGVLAAVGSATAALHRVWPVLLWSQAVAVLVPLAAGAYALALVCAGMAVSSYGATRYNIAQIAYFQQSCPAELLGRVSASNRFLVWATLPAGGLLGGILGTYLPVTAVLWLATAAQLASAVAGALPLHQMGTGDE